MKRKNGLKEVGVLLVVVAIVLSTVAVTANTVKIQPKSTTNFTTEVGNGYIDLEIVDVQAGFGKISAVLKNIGTRAADDIEWSISIDGGVLGFINVETSNIIPEIPVDGEEPIETDKLIFGLGPVDIQIETSYVSSNGTGFVFGPFIFNIQTTMVPVVTPWRFAQAESGSFPCTVHMKANGWAVLIHKVEWTKDGQVIYTHPVDPPQACGNGEEIELPTMYPPEEPNDVRIYWKAVEGGSKDDVEKPGVPDQDPIWIPHMLFRWNYPYPTNPK